MVIDVHVHPAFYGPVCEDPQRVAARKNAMGYDLMSPFPLELVEKRLATDQLVLTVGYDKASLDPERGYTGEVVADAYGRLIPRHAHGTTTLERPTSSGRRLTRAVLKTHYQAPPEDVPAWDAIYGGRPFVLAVDMDLRRMDAAIQAARERGHRQVAVAALKGQGEALLLTRYRGVVQFYALTDDSVTELLGRSSALYSPPRTQFLTSKGDVIDAPLIKAAGKTGRSSGGQMGPLV